MLDLQKGGQVVYIIDKNQSGVPKGKKRFRFDLRLLGKRHRKKIICQKAAVQALHREWEKSILENRDGNYLFFEKFNEYLNHVKATKSPSAYKCELMVFERQFKNFFSKNLRLNEFNRSNVLDFIKWKRSNRLLGNTQNRNSVSNSTINRYLSVLSSFFTYCQIHRYYRYNNPCFKTKLKVKNERKVRLSVEQINELLSKAFEQDERLYGAILTVVLTGMRRKELLSLEWTMVDFNTETIYLPRHITKANEDRSIPMPLPLKSYLLERFNSKVTQTVFHDIAPDFLRYQWNRLREKVIFGRIADGSYLRFHDLRHVYAQELLNRGIKLEDIQTLLGHADITTTQRRYAQFARPDLQEKVKVLDDLLLRKIK